MRILFITQYFWPEDFIINDLCVDLKKRGHSITILSGKPNYPKGKYYKGYNFFSKNTEIWNNCKIYRVNNLPRFNGTSIPLLLNYISYALLASIKIFFIKEKFDKILVYEPSPITVGIPAIFAKYHFKSPIYFWVQDLWPESLSAASNIKNKKLLNFVNKLTLYIYKHTRKILVQSKAFIPYLIDQGVESKKIEYYPNTIPEYYTTILPDDRYRDKIPKGFNIIFAGNIGEAQDFPTIIETAEIIKNNNILVNWIIVGDGRMKAEIESIIKKKNLQESFFFIGKYPSHEMPHILQYADILLVTLKKSTIFALTIPLKVQTYLAAGKPILASLDGEGSNIINESNAGFTSPSSNPVILAYQLEKIYKLSNLELKKLGDNGKNYFKNEFDRKILLHKLEIILNS